MRTFICGGTPTEHDLAVVQNVAAALALPTDDDVRQALYEMSEEGPRP